MGGEHKGTETQRSYFKSFKTLCLCASVFSLYNF